MKRAISGLVAAMCAAAASHAASAITFPSLTTIYVGSGVRSTTGAPSTGAQTLLHCSNVSGLTASIRFLLLGPTGALIASETLVAAHGATITVSTANVDRYTETKLLQAPAPQPFDSAVINIESTQSAVFCNAKIIDADATPADEPTWRGILLPLVRVNAHPGSVE